MTPPPQRTPDRPPAHQVEIAESGAFCTARCTCGWTSPARRSRDRARRDASGHLAA